MERVVSDPEVCSGKPVIRGTRIMVRNILDLLGADYSHERIIENYPALTPEDIQAAVQFARELVDEVRVLSSSG